MSKQEILLKDTDFIKDMQQSINYVKKISKVTHNKIVTLKAAINYMQSEINYYKRYNENH